MDRKITNLDFSTLKIRCSAISRIMAKPKDPALSVGAMSYAEELVDAELYNFSTSVDTKQMEKGTAVEIQSILQLNALTFKDYKKAEGQAENEFLKTEGCDIDDEENDTIIDIKSPWTKKTFPKTKRQAEAGAKKSGYPYQLQGYMSVFGRSKAQVAFCLQDTPEELCTWENPSLHNMDDVPEELKVTVINYEHSPEMEAQIYGKVVLMRKYAHEYYLEILKDHGLQYTGKNQ